MKEILEFISSLIWPGIAVWVIWMFRNDFKELIGRIGSIKYGEAEFLFQETTTEALEPSELVKQAMEIRDEEGFFLQESIVNMIRNSAYLSKSEEIKDSILVFSTRWQHTWLVATSNQIFFVLDDERTRASKKLIQTRLPIAASTPVTAELRKGRIGAFKLGEGGSWYYSADLLGPPSVAEKRLTRFVHGASN